MSGYKYSIEFTGGTLMQVRFAQAPNVGDVRSTLDQAGIKGAEITQFGSDLDYLIRAQDPRAVAQQTRGAESIATEIEAALTKRFGASAYTVQRTEAVGPQGRRRAAAKRDLRHSDLLPRDARSISPGASSGASASPPSSPRRTTFSPRSRSSSYAHLEISLVVVGGILTMIGYSLNDTIIIFDRVRENLRRRQKIPLYDTLNRSVNETLPRSVLTHATVFATLLALALLAGEVLRPFALVMSFGIFTGTFSSIYVASPLLLWIERKWPRAVEGGVAATGRARARGGASGDDAPLAALVTGRRAPAMRFIDSHSHLADPAFDADRDAVIERAIAAGARGARLHRRVARRRRARPRHRRSLSRFISHTPDVHPHDAASFDRARRGPPRARGAARSGAVAVGECGLDYHYDQCAARSRSTRLRRAALARGRAASSPWSCTRGRPRTTPRR